YKTNDYLKIASQVQTVTSPDSVLLIYGNQWNSFMPYYSQRRAIMFYTIASDEASKNAFYELSRANYKVEAIVFCNQARKTREDEKYLNDLYNPTEKPIFSNKLCDIYTTRHGK
ncbi:MAG: glycosyl transferase, partial [Microcystis sp. M04BS1]|nr:glycosyl transferase [Microcystis sp. M04BS1]